MARGQFFTLTPHRPGCALLSVTAKLCGVRKGLCKKADSFRIRQRKHVNSARAKQHSTLAKGKVKGEWRPSHSQSHREWHHHSKQRCANTTGRNSDFLFCTPTLLTLLCQTV